METTWNWKLCLGAARNAALSLQQGAPVSCHGLTAAVRNEHQSPGLSFSAGSIKQGCEFRFRPTPFSTQVPHRQPKSPLII